jgi:RHS repeat-associated protein
MFNSVASNLGSQSTGKERDAETGLDYFLARYYSGAQGRFLSPDEWKGGIVDPFTGQDIESNTALPYADVTDPQTLNKYAYVRNNPLRYTDPDGHCPWCITAGIGALTGGAVSLISQKWAHPDRLVNWTAVGAAAVGGAVAGATFGLMTAPALATTTLATGTTVVETGTVMQVGAGAISGVVGGIAKRETEAAITGGDANKAIGSPGQIAVDAMGGGVAAGLNAGAVKPMVKELSYAGRAVSIGEQKIAEGVRPSPNLALRQAQLKNLQTGAAAVGSTAVKSFIKREEERYK